MSMTEGSSPGRLSRKRGLSFWASAKFGASISRNNIDIRVARFRPMKGVIPSAVEACQTPPKDGEERFKENRKSESPALEIPGVESLNWTPCNKWYLSNLSFYTWNLQCRTFRFPILS